MATKVGSKGQIVIDKPVRDQLGIGAGWRSVQRVTGRNCVEIQFFPPDHERSLFGCLRNFAGEGDSSHSANDRAATQHASAIRGAVEEYLTKDAQIRADESERDLDGGRK